MEVGSQDFSYYVESEKLQNTSLLNWGRLTMACLCVPTPLRWSKCKLRICKSKRVYMHEPVLVRMSAATVCTVSLYLCVFAWLAAWVMRLSTEKDLAVLLYKAEHNGTHTTDSDCWWQNAWYAVKIRADSVVQVSFKYFQGRMPKDGAAIINYLIRIAIHSSYSSLHKFDWGSNIQNIIEANWIEPFTLGRNT